MGFEERRGKIYYYREQRRGETVVSEYVGSGFVAQYAALQDAREQRERAKKREIERQKRARFAEKEAKLAELEQQIKLLIEATYLINGYHQTKNRIWRRKR